MHPDVNPNQKHNTKPNPSQMAQHILQCADWQIVRNIDTRACYLSYCVEPSNHRVDTG